MAVVQISRIQQRRGKKNTNTGLPQLASGELAWCVDTQELYIGNGSVAEGAPFVGNTRFLTELDDLLSLVGRYQYAKNIPYIQTGDAPNFPVVQNLQDVLDRTIYIRNFGALGDGQNDDTAAIQRAIDQLFLNPSTQGLEQIRVNLLIEPGLYKITDTIYIPSYATLIGAGKDKTIFAFENSGTMMQFINDTSTSSSRSILSTTTGNNQPRFINIKGITFTTTAANQIGWQMDAVRDSTFTDITIRGGWDNLEAQAESKAIEMNAVSNLVTCDNNTFTNVEISDFSYAVWSDLDIETNVFNNCYFHDLYKGFSLGFAANLFSPGQRTGPRNVAVNQSTFYKIHHHGFIVYHGFNNSVSNSRFIDVGNNQLGNTFPVYAAIDFREIGNAVNNNKFDREEELESNLPVFAAVPYVPNVNAYGTYETKVLREVIVDYFPSYKVLFRLPIPIKNSAIVEGFSGIGYEIQYSYRSTNQSQSRFGKISIHADIANNSIQLVDDYEYTGTAGRDVNLEFKAEFLDADNNTKKDTLGVYYRNATVGDTALMCYSYKVLSVNQSS
jgi:hypothetical protein